MQLWIIFTAFVGTVSSVLPPIISKQYRSDYEYNKETDAFYKLHTESGDKFTASRKCLEEGAELATITSDEDLKQIYAIMKRFPHLFDAVMVAPQGVSRQPVDSFEDEDSTLNPDYGVQREIERKKCNAVNHFGQIVSINAFSYQPLMCKVAAKDAPYSEDCGVYGNGYESRISSTGSCYKASTSEATWDAASADCQAEGAHLVILNNAEELEVVHDLLKDIPFNSKTRYYAGLRAADIEPKVFRTVFNQTLEEVGFVPWAEGEPDVWYTGKNCLVLDPNRHSKYDEVWCYISRRYVCESVGSLPRDDLPSSANQSTFPGSTSVMMLVFAVISMLFV